LTTLDAPLLIDSKARYSSKIAIFAPVRGVHVGILTAFGVEKLERWVYEKMKNA